MNFSNPFIVQSPEDISAEDVKHLFVDVFTDFYKIREPGHTMVNGPRGCGKSMMFRYLLPDCQCLYRNSQLKDIDFFAVLVSIKNTDLNLTDLQHLINRHANIAINEHFLTMYVASKVFLALSKITKRFTKADRSAVAQFEKKFFQRLSEGEWEKPSRPNVNEPNIAERFTPMRQICDKLYTSVVRYVRQMSLHGGEPKAFRTPLYGYMDFLFPLLIDLRELPFMPKGPIYLLIDDADYLSHVQTMILNSWVSTRTSASVSIKISTQLRYKTYKTIGGMTIDSPHDYSDVNISDLYTSSRSKYKGRVEQIITKRLKLAGIDVTPEQFFPVDEAQEQTIKEIEGKLRKSWKVTGRGYRPGDDALRYARPTFMASLKGSSKSLSTYSYAGFDQLVHISSGLIRYFLEPAAIMFNEERARLGNKSIHKISPEIQNNIIRDESDRLMLAEFEKIFQEERDVQPDVSSTLLRQKADLHNLLKVLGGVFHLKLISNDSERRVFSLAFSDAPGEELVNLFKLGIQYGYFHQSTIGNKDGTGRTPLYVLTRRLAPHFNLDPTGFAGYLFVTSSRIQEAIRNPDSYLRKLKERGTERDFEERQLSLFS